MVHDIICWLYNINIFYCLDSISHCIIVHSVYFWSSSLILNIRILEAKRNTVRTSRLAHEGSCALMSTAAWTSVPDMELVDPDPMWTTWWSSSLKELRHPVSPRGGRQSTRQEWWLDSFSVSSLNTFLSFPVFKPMMYQYTPSLDARLFYSLHC